MHEGQGVEDVELLALGEDEGVVDEVVEAGLVSGTVVGLLESTLGAVVEEVGYSDDVVLRVVDNRRFNAVKREEVCNLAVLVLLGNESVIHTHV